MKRMSRVAIAFLLVVGLKAQTQQINLVAANPSPVQVFNGQITGQAGQQSFYYTVVTTFPAGDVLSQPFLVQGAPNTLNGSNFVTLFWNAVAGATSYTILRGNGSPVGAPCTSCVVISGTTGTTGLDNGGGLTNYTPNLAVIANATLRINSRDYALPTLEVGIASGTANATFAPIANSAGIIPCTVDSTGKLTCKSFTSIDASSGAVSFTSLNTVAVTTIAADDNAATGGTIQVSGLGVRPVVVHFAGLGTPANGIITYCDDCTVASPCAGSGTGAFAKRLNGAWVCN